MENSITIYTDGIFDLFHYGHAKCLEQIKEMYPKTTLIVGVYNDNDTIMYKGIPVMNQNERYESLRQCKWIDKRIQDAPLTITSAFIELHNIDYVKHDNLPYTDGSGCSEGDDCHGLVKNKEGLKKYNRTPDISTYDLILRIVNNYNKYVMYNISRRYTYKDVGMSLLKEEQIQMKFKLYNITRKIWNKHTDFYDKVLENILHSIFDFMN